VRWAAKGLAHPIKSAIGTHFHEDRIGGVDVLKTHAIPTFAHPLTCTLARQIGNPVPEPIADFNGRSHLVNADCELFFAGPGHTRDNIVVWLPEERLLFGGCFLKSSTSTGLGNVDDAVVSEWASSVRRVAQQFPGPRAVIPGHGTMTGDAIGQTLALLAQQTGRP
jgi:glyoxylase-like metal-dependent hydrolase (beta-lactamase superfamily II)